MDNKVSDAGNLNKAIEIKRSGFDTKVHASVMKPEIDKMLLEGKKPREVANWLSVNAPDSDNPSEYSIENYYMRYLIPEMKMKKDPRVEKLIKSVNDEFDIVFEMIALYRDQMSRISMDRKHEINVNKMFPHLKEEMKIALDILKSLSDLMLEMGILNRVPTVVENYSAGILKVEKVSEEDIRNIVDEYAKLTAIRQNIELQKGGPIEGKIVGERTEENIGSGVDGLLHGGDSGVQE